MQPTDIKHPDYFHKVVDCQWACPAHTPVPEYIRLIAAGRYSDAYMINWKSNVFPGILGRTLTLSAQPYTVVGVMPAGFRYLRPYNLFVALGPIAGEEWILDRGNHQGFVAVGRLRDGATADSAARELRDIEQAIVQQYPQSSSGISLIIEPLASMT